MYSVCISSEKCYWNFYESNESVNICAFKRNIFVSSTNSIQDLGYLICFQCRFYIMFIFIIASIQVGDAIGT